MAAPAKFENPIEASEGASEGHPFEEEDAGGLKSLGALGALKTRSGKAASRSVEKAKLDQQLKKAAFGGNDSADGDEGGDDDEERALKRWFGILHPATPSRHAYDMLQLVIMLYLGYLLPIRLAFTKTAEGPLEVTIDLLIDLSVFIDMFMQMNMCYLDKKTRRVVTDKARIKREYMGSWFLIDFFAVVPVDQVLLLVGTHMVENGSVAGDNADDVVAVGLKLLEWSVTARLARLLRLVRLVKIGQLINLDGITSAVYMLVKGFEVTKLQVAFYFRVVLLISLIMASGHVLGCIWLLIGRHNVLQQQNPSGWMVSAYAQDTVNMTKDFVSCIGEGFDQDVWNSRHGSTCINTCAQNNVSAHRCYCIPIPTEHPYDVDCSWILSSTETFGGTGFDDGVGASEGEQYLSAFYFALVTLTTVGYGDILPDTKGEKMFVMGVIIFGAFLYAFIIGNFSNLLDNLSQERDDFDCKMRSVNDLMAYINAPVELRDRVQDYFDFQFANKEGGSDEIMEQLPTGLQVDVVKHRYGQLINTVPFFATLRDSAVVELCQQMNSHTVPPGAAIMTKGEWHDELLILSKGHARTDILVDDEYHHFDLGSFW
jgi:hypothetical protein